MNRVPTSNEDLTLHEVLRRGEEILKAYQKLDAAIDAKLLMCYLLNCKSISLVLNRDEIISRQLQESYMYLIAKRSKGIPLQYITKSQEFMGLDFYVDERVLIPRQDTETLVETIIDMSKKETINNIVEVGCGSGCISIALAHFIPDVKITAIDISQDALEVTLKNAVMHNVSSQVTCKKSDLLNAFDADSESVDLVVSNPPYISKYEYHTLMKEIRDYEPKIALTDELDGLTFYRKISKDAKAFLRPSGIIAYEVGYNQSEAVGNILADEGFSDIKVIADLAQKDRVVTARR